MLEIKKEHLQLTKFGFRMQYDHFLKTHKTREAAFYSAEQACEREGYKIPYASFESFEANVLYKKDICRR